MSASGEGFRSSLSNHGPDSVMEGLSGPLLKHYGYLRPRF